MPTISVKIETTEVNSIIDYIYVTTQNEMKKDRVVVDIDGTYLPTHASYDLSCIFESFFSDKTEHFALITSTHASNLLVTVIEDEHSDEIFERFRMFLMEASEKPAADTKSFLKELMEELKIHSAAKMAAELQAKKNLDTAFKRHLEKNDGSQDCSVITVPSN